jgi:hypothetical protein
METPLTPIEKLDFILGYLANSQFALPHLTFEELYNYLRKAKTELGEQEDFGVELRRVLNKLEKDGYVETENRPLDRKPVYWASVEGGEFIERGGYKKRLQEDIETKELVRRQIETAINAGNSSITTNDSVRNLNIFLKRTNILTTIIAALTVVFIVLQYFKDDSKNLLPITKQLERQTQILDSLAKFQKEIGSSLVNAVKDSSDRHVKSLKRAKINKNR